MTKVKYYRDAIQCKDDLVSKHFHQDTADLSYSDPREGGEGAGGVQETEELVLSLGRPEHRSIGRQARHLPRSVIITDTKHNIHTDNPLVPHHFHQLK